MTLLDFTFRLLIALALRTVVGLERQYRQRMAGLRQKVVSRLGVESGASAVSWKIVPTADEEQAMLSEA